MYLKKLKIGNVKLNNNLILAPMAGVTDLPFRRIAEKFEPGMVCTEMVSAKALFYGDEKTKQLLCRFLEMNQKQWELPQNKLVKLQIL